MLLSLVANRGPAFVRAAFLLLVGVALAACTTGGGGGLFGGGATASKDAPGAPKKVFTAEDLVVTYCPPLDIRTGTEALAVYNRGHDGDPAFVRYQASIGKTARACHITGDTMTIKVGVSGSVVGGPKGGAGAVALPLRVAVVKQSAATKPAFSQLFKVTATLAAPEFRSDYSFVQEISFKLAPTDRDFIVYVGFDEGKKS
jgi:hypothetical protein